MRKYRRRTAQKAAPESTAQTISATMSEYTSTVDVRPSNLPFGSHSISEDSDNVGLASMRGMTTRNGMPDDTNTTNRSLRDNRLSSRRSQSSIARRPSPYRPTAKRRQKNSGSTAPADAHSLSGQKRLRKKS